MATDPAATRFDLRTLDQLHLEDEAAFRPVGLYADLKDVLLRAGTTFRLLPAPSAGRWDRALFLNLAYWSVDGGGDVLVDDHLAADVVTHVAWHHLAAKALPPPPGGHPSAESLFLGEAIASAFDLYLVGRLLGHTAESQFLDSQVPAMAEAASAAGLSDDGFEALLEDVTRDPERAFEDLRELLFDATVALLACRRADDALAALATLDGHRFAPLLHHYELATWVLDARGRGGSLAPDEAVRALDRTLREAPVALDWLERHWVRG
ncbi:MAG: hypothetical protein EOO75_11440 [Myxococcales bacterium]|nr:MAG: hypothetical protein EOO75_11440 [Myxococcales bacterium]